MKTLTIRSAKQILAATLCLGLILSVPSSSAFASPAARAVAVKAPVGVSQAGIAGAAIQQVLAVPIGGLAKPLSSNLGSRLAAPQLKPVIYSRLTPLARPAAVTPAPLDRDAAVQALERHPIIGIVNEVQNAGGDALLGKLGTATDAAQVRAVAEALPAGAARNSIEALAGALSLPEGAERTSALNSLYENTAASYRTADLMPAVKASEAAGVWARIARAKSRLLPAGLKRYAADRAEQRRAKAPLIDTAKLKIPTARLRWVPDAKDLPGSTREIKDGETAIVGQDRALKSLEFGLKYTGKGSDVVVTGPDGSGRKTAIRQLLKRIAPTMKTPPDIISVTDLKEKGAPDIIAVEAGSGAKVKAAMDAERYKVEILIDNSGKKGAPVVFEKSPSVKSLVGAALRANGGFLVVDVMDLLKEQGAYQALMQIIRDGRIAVAAGRGESYAIPVRFKTVLTAAPAVKALLAEKDPGFTTTFGTSAEFEKSIGIGGDTVAAYLAFMKRTIAQSAGEILDMARGAIAGALEYAARIAESNQKLSASFGPVAELMSEASFWAKESGRGEVTREDVDKAVSERSERSGAMRRHVLEYYSSDIFRVDIEGSQVGQINGLAVMGDFGVPTRITFAPYAKPGSDFVVSADERAESAGKHFKKSLGVIKGFIGRTFGIKRAIPVEVSISFEQNYGGIDGDSATQTMIYGTLSALSGVGIKQGIAITGSADQSGNVQVIGGVNHKIEGYFDVAREKLRREGKEMTGEQGIIIPAGNIRDLTLRPDIVQAVREGKFNIWAVEHVSQGTEILTGQPYSEVIRKAEAYIGDVRANGASS
ncbi:MAG: Lon-insertion domain-containing protein [Elusimicrobiota bacterium]